jgi:hypothetical protein
LRQTNKCMDQEEEITPHYNVSAKKIHGATVRLRVLFLFGGFCFVAGFFIGGYTLPYLKFKPDINSSAQKAQNPARDAIMASVGAQTVWAAPVENAEPISTNLSVEQLINEYQVLGESNGYIVDVEFDNNGENFEARLSFQEPDKEVQKRTFAAPPNKDFYKSLVLIFTRGTQNGTSILSSMRKNGEEISKGAAFVDLMNFGTQAPQLAPNQFLTAKGIFEIVSNDFGSIATIDGKQIYPILDESIKKPTLGIGKDNEKIGRDEPKEGSPQVLRLLGVQSNSPNLKERLILVASTIDAPPCTSKAIIIDVVRDKVTIVPNMLRKANVIIGNSTKSFTLNGFCESGNKPQKNENYRVEANYNLVSGEIAINHVPNSVPLPANNNPPIAQATNGAWRQTSNNRIASPFGNNGALISMSCRPSGGISIAVAGLPAPQDGKAANISFGNAQGSQSSPMNWYAGSKSYEINSSARPIEIKQIAKLIRGGGNIAISGAGGQNNVQGPSAAQVDNLLANCNSQPSAPNPAQIQTPSKTPKPVTKPEVKQEAKPISKSEVKPIAKPVAKPITKTITKPTEAKKPE